MARSGNKTGFAARFRVIEVETNKTPLRERMAKRANKTAVVKAQKRDVVQQVWKEEKRERLAEVEAVVTELITYGRWIDSKFEGRCILCRSTYLTKERVLWSSGFGCLCRSCYDKSTKRLEEF